MSVFSDSSPIIIKKRKGNSIEPFKPIEERILILENGFGILDELPDKFTKVAIDGMVEINTEFTDSNVIKHENEYIVNYNRGFIYFHKNKIKQEIMVNYKGTGVVLYPASRIYDTGNTDITTTIQEMIDGGRDAIETYSNISNAIKVGNETYVKLSTTIDNANKINNVLNITIIEAKDIDSILKETIKSATNINNTLNGSIKSGTSKIQEMDNKIIEVNKRVSEINKEESIRNTNENTRKSNEVSRENNENTRKSSENQRLKNEKVRQSQETNRVNSENKRIEGFNQIKETINNTNIKQQAEIKKISDLNTNINKQETKRQENENSRQTSFTNIQNTLKTTNTNISICEDYSSKKQYKKLNRVIFKGSSYECLKDCVNIEPNATNKEYWICIAQRGQDGEGTGNMHSNIYDKNNDGVVDRAEKSNNSDKLGNKNANEYVLKTEAINIKEQQNTNVNRIDDLNKNTKIAIENLIEVERNSIGLNPLNSLNYVGGNTFQANVPIIINSGKSELNYNSEVELVNNNNVTYKPAKDKTIENSKTIEILLEKINKLEEKVKSLEAVDK